MAYREQRTFIQILDTTKPDWWLVYATQQELMDCVRQCTDEQSGTVKAKEALRRSVIERLAQVGRAGAQWSEEVSS